MPLSWKVVEYGISTCLDFIKNSRDKMSLVSFHNDFDLFHGIKIKLAHVAPLKKNYLISLYPLLIQMRITLMVLGAMADGVIPQLFQSLKNTFPLNDDLKNGTWILLNH